MGNAVYCMPRHAGSACSERYADDMPLSLPYRQLPPTSEPASKQSKGMPRACRTWHDAIPDDPAPMTHARSMSWCPYRTPTGVTVRSGAGSTSLPRMDGHQFQRSSSAAVDGTSRELVLFCLATLVSDGNSRLARTVAATQAT